ncbi:hypothetical protein ES708_05169 [subsurface metagenome]
MSKLVRVDGEVYDELETIRDKRETFSQVIARLVDIRRMVLGIEPILRGHIAFEEFKKQRDQEKEALEGRLGK